jgi:L-fuculose-phosphate aldolase
MEDLDVRTALISSAQAMDRAGLAPNKSGNVSCRLGEGMLITPAALAYATLVPGDLVHMSLEGESAAGARRPSSEWPMHAAIYRARGAVGAVVHTHSPHATALSEARIGIPPIHYMIAIAGGAVRCAPYATFGTSALADNALEALRGRRAALLGNHGVVAVGRDTGKALTVAIEVENLARQYLLILSAGLVPELLDDAELERVIEKFADYGRAD